MYVQRTVFHPFIYGLIDPLDVTHVRYVGMSGVHAKRPYDHAKKARTSDKQSHLYFWIQKIQAEGREPSVLILEELPVGTPRQLLGFVESCYIKSLREIGHKLTNATEGGDGFSSAPKSEEHKRNISIALTGLPRAPHTAATKALMSAKKKGVKQYWNGERRGSAKLTETSVLAIRADARMHAQIAAQYGVSKCTVSKIKARLKWAHVDGPPSVYRRKLVH